MIPDKLVQKYFTCKICNLLEICTSGVLTCLEISSIFGNFVAFVSETKSILQIPVKFDKFFMSIPFLQNTPVGLLLKQRG